MGKQLRIFKSENGFWYCELWVEIMDSKMFEFEDYVKAENYQELQIEIGNKNWIDLLNK